MQQPAPNESPVSIVQSAPPPPPQQYEEVGESRRGCAGCSWGIAGALGCLVLLALPFVVALVLGTTTINSIFSGISSIFNPPPPVLVFNLASVVEKVQNLSQLTTVRYNYSGIVTTSTDMPGLLNALYGQQLVLIAVGHITAGVDLSQLTEEDVTLNDGVLTINLPAASLQDCFLNEQETYVAERSGGAFSHTTGQNNIDAESRRYALHQFRDTALEKNILLEAQTSAQKAIQEFIAALGVSSIQQVQVLVAPPNPEAPLPASCQ